MTLTRDDGTPYTRDELEAERAADARPTTEERRGYAEDYAQRYGVDMRTAFRMVEDEKPWLR